MMKEEALLEIAYNMGEGLGLQTIETQDYTWVRFGDWMGELGLIGGRADPETPIFVVAMRGTGIWSGPGLVPADFKIDGVTVALEGQTGRVLSTAGGYLLPTEITGLRYQQILDHPTLAPIVPMLLEQTQEPMPQAPILFPTPQK